MFFSTFFRQELNWAIIRLSRSKWPSIKLSRPKWSLIKLSRPKWPLIRISRPKIRSIRLCRTKWPLIRPYPDHGLDDSAPMIRLKCRSLSRLLTLLLRAKLTEVCSKRPSVRHEYFQNSLWSDNSALIWYAFTGINSFYGKTLSKMG